MPKTSVKALAKDALRQDLKQRQAAFTPATKETLQAGVKALAQDSFVNFAQKLGIGADNSLSTASYGFNPITRQRILLEWVHRGSWLGGVSVDVVADDMTRMGVEYATEMKPDDMAKLDQSVARMGVWTSINETIKWARLYGGCVAVMLIDGQDLRTPLNVETVGKGAFKGLLVLDRWMLDPALEDLVTEFGPHLGLPKYYRVGSNAPALRNNVIHYSRLALRLVGVQLPYQQRLTENLWGLSILERLWDRMIAFDTASTGAAQLVGKAYLRTLAVKGMREVASSGGPALEGLTKYVELMRRYQGIEGITLIDAEDTFEALAHGAFSGLDSVLSQFALQLSGALQIPLTRLFGQSPAGFSDGDNDVRNYYDKIKQAQETDLSHGVHNVYKCVAASEGIKVSDDFDLNFRSLWQLDDKEKSDIGKTTTDTVLAAKEAALISDKTALQELRQSSKTTGIWTNITDELIEAAAETIPDPMEGMLDPETGMPMPGAPGFEGGESGNQQAGPAGPQGAMDASPVGRKRIRITVERGS